MKNSPILIVLFLILFCCGNKEVKKEVLETPQKTEEIVDEPETFVESKPEIVFTVQIAALQNPNSNLQNLEGVKVYQENGLHKYLLGYHFLKPV